MYTYTFVLQSTESCRIEGYTNIEAPALTQQHITDTNSQNSSPKLILPLPLNTCITVCGSVLQCVVVCCSVLQRDEVKFLKIYLATTYIARKTLPHSCVTSRICVAVCCSVLQRDEVKILKIYLATTYIARKTLPHSRDTSLIRTRLDWSIHVCIDTIIYELTHSYV